jgi:hypothetical protein
VHSVPSSQATYKIGSSGFFKLTMLSVVLDRQKISKTILEKVFFFILWCFYLFFGFCVDKFKIGPSER